MAKSIARIETGSEAARPPRASDRTRRLACTSHIDCSSCWVSHENACGLLEPHEQTEMERAGVSLALPPNETIFLEGAPIEFVYTVTSGYLKLTRALDDGASRAVGFALPGEYLGVNEGPLHSFSAETLTPATMCRFPRETFHRLLERRPKWKVAVLDPRALDEAERPDPRAWALAAAALRRVTTFLVDLDNRMERHRGPFEFVALPMTLWDMAEHLQLSIEAVSRAFAELEERRVIMLVPGGISVLDEVRLEALQHD